MHGRNITRRGDQLTQINRRIRLEIVAICAAALVGVLVISLLFGCDYAGLKAESAKWRQRSDALQVERDELRAEAARIIRAAQLEGYVDESASARLDEITKAIGVVSAAIDVAHEGIRKVDDTIQAQAGWFELADTVIGAAGVGVPGIGLAWGIVRGIWRRRFGQLVANVQRASSETSPDVRTLNTATLGKLNAGAGLQPHIDKPLAIAKAEEAERRAA